MEGDGAATRRMQDADEDHDEQHLHGNNIAVSEGVGGEEEAVRGEQQDDEKESETEGSQSEFLLAGIS